MSTSEPFLIKGFKKLVKEEKLAQSYIFFGSNTFGILEFSRGLVNFLEHEEWVNSEKPLLDSLFLKPEDYQIIKQFLWQKPIISKKKTIVIPDSQKLILQAQNAILKIAEEPPTSALIILLAKDPDLLIPTLASRFQKIYFGNPNVDPLKENVTLAKDFLKMSFRDRKEFIKEIIEEDGKMESFISALILELSHDKIKNWRPLKEILNRWSLINRYNVNKRLQLEAALMDI